MTVVRKKVSAMDPVGTITGGLLLMFTEDGVDNYQGTVDELSAYLSISAAIGVDKQGVKNADFVYNTPADSIITGFDFKKTVGNPVCKVGTTPGGEEILDAYTIGDAVTGIIAGISLNSVQEPFDVATDIYISVAGGSVKVNIRITNTYFA
jgi:hypothetical protein